MTAHSLTAWRGSLEACVDGKVWVATAHGRRRGVGRDGSNLVKFSALVCVKD
ncbi:hypothetical protein TSUD_277930 [Trifolium subterraneum]|uniref:Uncharacterized protein n=1 Tax=Trifolium subterraneum TaxID=3900 RepID=A0A2Z6MRD9_TRISU|nr:hypothetical protein TSUD_277930 [Trifolium subterraneum]